MKKITFGIISFFVVLTAGLWLFVSTDAFEQKIRALVLYQVREISGIDVRIGRVKVNILPPTIEIRDVVVPSPRSTETISARKITLYINLFPLIYKTVSIRTLSILEPKMTALRTANGRIDIVELFQTLKNNLLLKRKSSSSSISLRIRAISVQNGALAFLDEASGTALSFSNINLRSRISIPDAMISARSANAKLTVAIPSYPVFSGDVRTSIAYEQGMIKINALDFISETVRFAMSGTAPIEDGQEMNLKTTLQIGQKQTRRVTAFLQREKALKRSIDAEAHIHGTWSKPQINGSIRFSRFILPASISMDGNMAFKYQNNVFTLTSAEGIFNRDKRQLPLREIALEASYRSAGVDIMRFLIKADDIEILVSGRVDAAAGCSLSISAETTGIGSALTFLSGIESSGNTVLSGTLSGPIKSPRFDGTLSAGPIAVRGVVFQRISGLVSFKDKMLSLDSAAIQQDSSSYVFDGLVNFHDSEPHFKARLGVIHSDVAKVVALFYKPIPLEIGASGELTFEGTRKVFTGTGRLELSPGKAYGESFSHGTLSVELTSSRIVFPAVVIEKGGGLITGRGWIGFDKTYFGAVEGTNINLSAVDHLRTLGMSGLFSMNIRSSGTFASPIVHARGESEAAQAGNVILGALDCSMDISDGKMMLSTTLKNKQKISANLLGSLRVKPPYLWDATLSVDATGIDLSEMGVTNDLLGKLHIAAAGSIQAFGNGTNTESIAGAAHFSRIGISFGELHLGNEGDVDIRIDAGRTKARSFVMSGSGTKLSIAGDAKIGKDLDVVLSGTASLSLLRILYKAVEHGDGTAALKLAIRDDWNNPDVEGQAFIQDGQIKIKDIPQKFTALNGSIVFDRNRIVSEGINGEIGGGTITVSGSADLNGSALVDFYTKAVVDNVTVRYPPGLRATLGGVLYYDGDSSAQTLSGELNVRQARYEKFVEWKSMLVDFRSRFTRPKKSDIGWIGDTQLNLRFTGKENIIFESNLAKIPLEIDMLLRGTVNQPQVLGRIEARKGDVYFRNNVFRILNASVDFADPNRINPVLDVQAETRAREYRIRLGVTGTADRAVVNFVSDPPLSDADILAMLALGRKSDELVGKEATVGVGEATSFATGKFQDIIESRARSLTGLDRFQVDPYISKTDTAVPRVTVGKEVVQDRLFVTYSSNVGAPTPEQLFRIEYILNRNISVVGERTEIGNIGADIKFRFEFR